MSDRRHENLFLPGQSASFISAMRQRALYDEDERLRARIQELQLQEIILRREMQKRYAHLRPKPIRPNMCGDRHATMAERLIDCDDSEESQLCEDEQEEDDRSELVTQDGFVDSDDEESSASSEYWDARSHQSEEEVVEEGHDDETQQADGEELDEEDSECRKTERDCDGWTKS